MHLFKKCHLRIKIRVALKNDITLRDGFALRMDTHNDKVRVIILQSGMEYVCRMETLAKLRQFTEQKEARIFKGRLQLFKEEGLINVIAKGMVAGIVEEEIFVKCLDGLQW
jgi:hypothetical protein